MTTETCTWCGAEVEQDDGYRAYEPAGERRAVFCRLEHVIPWSIQDAHWEPARPEDGFAIKRVAPGLRLRSTLESPLRCSQCDAELGEVHVLLVRHRGEHRLADAFCSVDHMEAWAKAGGRWQ